MTKRRGARTPACRAGTRTGAGVETSLDPAGCSLRHNVGFESILIADPLPIRHRPRELWGPGPGPGSPYFHRRAGPFARGGAYLDVESALGGVGLQPHCTGAPLRVGRGGEHTAPAPKGS